MAIERTFSIIKPDAVAKNVIGPITAKLEQAGLRVLASKMVRLTEAQATQFFKKPMTIRFGARGTVQSSTFTTYFYGIRLYGD